MSQYGQSKAMMEEDSYHTIIDGYWDFLDNFVQDTFEETNEG